MGLGCQPLSPVAMPGSLEIAEAARLSLSNTNAHHLLVAVAASCKTCLLLWSKILKLCHCWQKHQLMFCLSSPATGSRNKACTQMTSLQAKFSCPCKQQPRKQCRCKESYSRMMTSHHAFCLIKHCQGRQEGEKKLGCCFCHHSFSIKSDSGLNCIE